ncbi:MULTISPECIES: translocase [Shimia]|uniref:translocase n=1 Tax=Shimia TaxID=573139 RepID=UPI001FB2DAF4|nr:MULTISPECIES: translocase [Shimia]MDV4144609.1 translocase [Shimia sp. FJ5]
MVRKINVYRRYALAGATLSCAASIGFLMQSSEPGYAGHQLPEPGISLVGNVIEASLPNATSETVQIGGLPALPREVSFDESLSHKTVALIVSSDAPVSDMPEEVATPNLACDVSLTAEPLPAALVALQLTAPCLTGERVVVHHGDLKFADTIGPDGSLRVDVPALTESATFVAVLTNGDGAVAKADVPSLQFYDRVAVQWQGDTGLALHAREYGAEYESAGHVWREARRDVTAIVEGNKGFLVRLGNADLPEPLLAEVYTFPTGSAKKAGEVALSVEADVSQANCGRQISAGSIEVRRSEPAVTHQLSVEMPECDAVGELLVLKNLLQDLKIASK